jgi:uridine kinase
MEFMSSIMPEEETLMDAARLVTAYARTDGPTLVAVDGLTGAGKTSFAEGLARRIHAGGFAGFTISVDDFHNPRSKRHSMGRHSAEGYFRCSHNIAQLRRSVLDPIRNATGEATISRRGFDLANDVEVNEAPVTVPTRSIVICEGSFLLSQELSPYWSFRIYLNACRDIAVSRVVERDARLFENIDGRALVAQRYHGAHDIHTIVNVPQLAADLVIHNSNPARPIVICEKQLVYGDFRGRPNRVLLARMSDCHSRPDEVFAAISRSFSSNARLALWEDRREGCWRRNEFEDAAIAADRSAFGFGLRVSCGFCSQTSHGSDDVLQNASAFFGVEPSHVVFWDAL